jgi:hypothetical protein
MSKKKQTIAQSFPGLDENQANQQLHLLGYRPGDKIYLTAFFPKDDAKSTQDKGRKSERLNYKQVEGWQKEGRGVYFVVNGGGHKADEVTSCRAIFYEHDNLDKENQLLLWETLGLPEPTFQVDTGGKSIHSYWVFNTPISPDVWKTLQTDLLKFADADRALKNPNRVMRLAGAWHIKGDGLRNQSQIITSSGKRYTFEELRAIIPTCKVAPTETPRPYKASPQTNYQWTGREWALSYLEALSPYRADDYDNWLAVGMALHSVDDSLLTEWDNWSRQSPKYSPGCCDKKWKSFKSQGVSIGSLAHMAKQDGWRSPFEKSSGRGYSGGIGSGNKPPNLGGSGGSGGGDGGDGNDNNSKAVSPPGIQELTSEEVRKLIDEIIQQGLDGAELRTALNDLSHCTPWRIDQLYKLHQQKLEDIERVELRDNTREQLESLLSASNASLDLHQFLHPNLAKPLLRLSSRLSLKPEVYLTTLLTVASSLHHPQTRIWLSKEDDFDQPAGLYSGIVAETSQKKSPVLKAIATKPLKVLQAEQKHFFEQKLKAYHYALEDWEKLPPEQKREVDPPVKPERAILYFTKTTGEGLEYQAARQPEQGMLYLSDELPAIVNNQNKYTNGKGSDRQDLLSYYDATANTTLRADGIKSELDSILLAILGGIQPQVLQTLLSNCEDNDGNWARFLFVNQPSVAGRLHADGGRVDLTGLLVDLYRKIRALPTVEYTLSPEAFKVFQQAYNRYEQNRVNDPLVGMKSVWGKSEGRVGRLALNLHVINSLANGETPSEQIEADTVKRAIALTDYYAMQVKAMYTEFSDKDALAPHLAKVIEMSLKRIPSKSQGWLKASDVYLAITKAKRPTGEKVRLWFSELVTLGKGEVKGVGRSLLFRAFSPSPPPLVKLDKLDTELDILSKTEPTIYQEVQEKLDKLDKLDNFQKNQMVVELIEEDVDLTTGVEKKSLLGELSNLSNFTQDVEFERDAALDNLSNELSNLDNQSQVEVITLVPSKETDSTFADESEKVVAEERDDNSTQDNMAKLLSGCTTMQEPATRLSCCNPQAKDEAYSPLSPKKQAQIEERKEELDKLTADFQVGNHVYWSKCPAHCEQFAPFEITAIDGDYAKLDLFENPVLLVELRKA